MEGFSSELLALAGKVEQRLAPAFARIDQRALLNTKKVMDAFREFRVQEGYFAGTTGYGYDDMGRDALEKIYARVFGAEAALVRTQFVNGTHAIAAGMFACVSSNRLCCASTKCCICCCSCFRFSTVSIAADSTGFFRYSAISSAAFSIFKMLSMSSRIAFKHW